MILYLVEIIFQPTQHNNFTLKWVVIDQKNIKNLKHNFQQKNCQCAGSLALLHMCALCIEMRARPAIYRPITRGISIQGEVRNARKKRVTQQPLCSKF